MARRIAHAGQHPEYNQPTAPPTARRPADARASAVAARPESASDRDRAALDTMPARRRARSRVDNREPRDVRRRLEIATARGTRQAATVSVARNLPFAYARTGRFAEVLGTAHPHARRSPSVPAVHRGQLRHPAQPTAPARSTVHAVLRASVAQRVEAERIRRIDADVTSSESVRYLSLPVVSDARRRSCAAARMPVCAGDGPSARTYVRT